MDSYRSLDVWKVAHEVVLVVFRSCDEAYHARARAMFDQLRRAALSVEANLVEGYALGTAPLFRRHLRIAFGSAAEAECVARAAGELGYLPNAIVDSLQNLLGRAMQMLRRLLANPPAMPDTRPRIRRTTHDARGSTHDARRTTHGRG